MRVNLSLLCLGLILACLTYASIKRWKNIGYSNRDVWKEVVLFYLWVIVGYIVGVISGIYYK
jgi:hypothetical protein